MRLVLLRHGATEANEKRLYCGSTDLPLSAAGRRALSERRRKGELSGFRFFHSGARRTEETLRLLFGEEAAAAACPLPAFREMDFGRFEMHSYEELKEEADYLDWISGDNEANVTPGGESGAQMSARVLAALEALLKEDRDTVLVSHGGPIAAIMAKLFPEEGKNRYQWQPGPGEGYLIETDGGLSYTGF